MENSHFSEKYSRQIKLPEIGESGQKKLQQASVLIVGIGGLGCPAAQYLTAAGVGTVAMMDHDMVHPSNLHRQILFTEADIGKPKVNVAKEALERMSSDTSLISLQERLNEENALQLFEAYDLVIDGSDNFQTKYLINDAALLAGKPWVYASIFKFQGQLSVFNFREGPTYRCLFPASANQNVSCEEAGVMGVLPGVLGTLQASEAIKVILNIGEPLTGKLKIIDLLTFSDQLIHFGKNETEIENVKKRGLRTETFECEFESSDKLYLDVREPHEEPRAHQPNVLNIPISQLKERHEEIPKNQKVYVVCQSGIRSRTAIDYLNHQFGFRNLLNVDDGIQSVLKKKTHA